MVKEEGIPISRTGALSVTVTVIEGAPTLGISQLARQLWLKEESSVQPSPRQTVRELQEGWSAQSSQAEVKRKSARTNIAWR
jgi:hypothetical protein